jgi:hypothetical protein
MAQRRMVDLALGLGVIEHERNADRTGKLFEPGSHIHSGVWATRIGFDCVFQRGVASGRFTSVLDTVHYIVMLINIHVPLQLIT